MLTDAGRYDYLPLIDRRIIRWPENAHGAFWVAPNIEFYEINPPDGPGRPLWPRPYPDVLNYSLRDGSVWQQTGLEIVRAFKKQIPATKKQTSATI